MLVTTDTHVFFYYGDDIYSNFYRSAFTMAGVEFFCSEQAFMWAKAVYFRDYAVANDIANVDPTPHRAPFDCKMLGRKVRPYDEEMWNKVRYEIMCSVLMEKFKQNPVLAEMLLATDDRVLVEASPTDLIWGVGLAADHPDIHNPLKWRGLNLLGNALMYVRERLRALHRNNSIH